MKQFRRPLWFVGAAILMSQTEVTVATLSQGEVTKFTFGTPASVTRAGFTKVTANDKFTPDKGFGLDRTEGLLALDRGGW